MKSTSSILVILCLSLLGCASIYQEGVPIKEVDEKRDLFVFYDGTANDPTSATNVWKLYQIVKNDNKETTGITYIEGVGTRDKPILGMALGRGMEERVLMGYEYLIRNYRPGDDVYIIGFSRGAHQARALAGFISYAGIPVLKEKNNHDLMKLGNKIIEITKEKNDSDYRNAWQRWKSGDKPLLHADIRNKLGVETQAVEIAFLGVWDTVPGSSFKEFDICKEKPDGRNGDRYKSDSYPTIKYIAHAVSIDEKRSKFSPLLICPPIQVGDTQVSEVWFPGAHADVGGGYEDENSLSGISLQWMLDNLAMQYTFKQSVEEIEFNHKGLAHWSIGDSPANKFSECRDRIIPEDAVIHETYENRKIAGVLPIRIDGEVVNKPYPISCSDIRL